VGRSGAGSGFAERDRFHGPELQVRLISHAGTAAALDACPAWGARRRGRLPRRPGAVTGHLTIDLRPAPPPPTQRNNNTRQSRRTQPDLGNTRSQVGTEAAVTLLVFGNSCQLQGISGAYRALDLKAGRGRGRRAPRRRSSDRSSARSPPLGASHGGATLLWCVIPYKNETLGAPTHVYKVTHKKGYAARIRDGRAK
jgi:hypothetical protein